MVIKSRIMNRPEDYEKLGLKKGTVEKWEDGRRDFSTIGACEWWYFDGIVNNGITVALSFHTRSPLSMDREGDCPLISISIEFPNGKKYAKYIDCSSDEAIFSTEQCGVKLGKHEISGDLHEYKIHINPVDGYGVDLLLHSESSPWRPDTGYFVFGDDEEQFFTWLCVVPRGHMEGTLIVDNEEIAVSGVGYHDHQWTNHPRSNTLWNHWTWGRLHYEDYTLLLFDFTHARQYGFVRYPLFVLQDKNGEIVFENTQAGSHFSYEVIQEADYHLFGKDYPEVTKYHFEKDGKVAEFLLTAKEVLFSDDRHNRYSPALQKELDEMGFCWTYMHYLGSGELTLTKNGNTIKRIGDMIYELSYFGKNYKTAEQ